MSALTPLRIFLLGRFHVSIGDDPVPEHVWRRRRVASLLQLLALSPGFRLHREQVYDTLWPDLGPDAARNNLNVTIHQIRRDVFREKESTSIYLQRSGSVVALAPADRIIVDVLEFESLSERSMRSGDPGELRKAIDLYHGHLLPDSPYEEWIDHRRTSLRMMYLSALSQLGSTLQSQDRNGEAISVFNRLLSEEPFDEEAIRQLMICLAKTGQRTRAIDLYHEFSARLEEELRTEPETETRDLLDEILSLRTAPSSGQDARSRYAVPFRPSSGRTVLNPARDVPALPGSLVGRDQAISEISNLLAKSRLVTLTGPGGVGKTALSIAVAHHVSSEFASVYYVPLEHTRTSEFVMPVITQDLGIQLDDGESDRDALVRAIQEKQSLLVLDNFEQVVEAAPDLAYVLSRCNQVTLLVTSRVRLRLQGEQEYPVTPLPAPPPGVALDSPDEFPALKLMEQRIRQLNPHFTITPTRAGAMAEICRRLDGLPLAIEIAAARCKVFSPEALVPRLDQRLSVLRDGPRDLPERQQTIRDAIAWSYGYLSENEQRLLCKVSVFAGGWDIQAAEAIYCPDSDTESDDFLDLIFALVEHNLVVTDDHAPESPRFRMLETIRAFALEQLDAAPDAPEVRERHARYYAGLVERAMSYAVGEHQIYWLDRVSEEQPNIQAALDWFLEHDVATGLRMIGPLWLPWWMRRHLSVARHYYEAFLKRADAPGIDLNSLAFGLSGAGIIMEWQGDLEQAERTQRRALEIWLSQSQPPGESYWPFVSLGNIAYNRSDLVQAENWYQQGFEFARKHGHVHGQHVTQDLMAIVAIHQGRYVRAEALLRENLASAEARSDTWSISETSRYLGMLLLSLGRYQEALPLLTTAFEGAERLGHSIDQSECLRCLGVIHVQADAFGRARKYFQEAIEISIRAADYHGIAWAKNGLGMLAIRESDLETAFDLFAESIDATNHALDKTALPGAVEGLAVVLSMKAKHEQALEQFAWVARFREETGFTATVPESTLAKPALAASRSALPDEVIERLWDSGASRTLGDLLELKVRQEG